MYSLNSYQIKNISLMQCHIFKNQIKKGSVKNEFPVRSSGTCECFPESIISSRCNSLMSKKPEMTRLDSCLNTRCPDLNIIKLDSIISAHRTRLNLSFDFV